MPYLLNAVQSTDVCQMQGSQAVSEVLTTELTEVNVIAAKAMRILVSCDSKITLMPAIQILLDVIGIWYDSLPAQVKASELFSTPWNEPKVCLGYVHLGHLGAITLILRKVFSIYRPKAGKQTPVMQQEERGHVWTVLNDGVVAAKQASRVLNLFLGEQAIITLLGSHVYPHRFLASHTCAISLTLLGQLYCLRLCRHPSLLRFPKPSLRVS